MQNLEVTLGRMVVSYAILEAIAFALAMVVLYYVLKLAIREGIRESGLIEERNTWRTAVRSASERSSETDFRASR